MTATKRAIVMFAPKRLFMYIGIFCMGTLRRENRLMAVNMTSGDSSSGLGRKSDLKNTRLQHWLTNLQAAKDASDTMAGAT